MTALTIQQLINQLSRLDPTLPIGIIDIDRNPGSQRATISLRTLVDVDVTHNPDTGAPLTAWLVAQPPNPGHELDAPHTVVLPRDPCDCLIPVPLEQQRSINLDAYSCPHHKPNELVIRSHEQRH